MRVIGDVTGWTALMKRVFNDLSPIAMYAAGPVQPVPIRIGGNRPGRPLRLGATQSWKDHISAQLDKAGYICEIKVHFRIWVRNEVHVNHLIDRCMSHWNGSFDALRNPWIDAGEDYQPDDLEKIIMQNQPGFGFEMWTDATMRDEVERLANAWMADPNARRRRAMA